MPRNTTLATAMLPANAAALVLALDADTSGYPAGCNAHIFPDGAFRADDGRPASITGGEVRDWQMNAAIAADLIGVFEANAKPILYDYEHNSLCGDSRAAGWIDKLVYVPGQGVYAHVEWTPKAAEDIAKKVYRYSSPYFYFDPKTGAVKQLISTALTNNPALGDLGAVGLKRTADFSTATAKEADMADEKQVAALTAERDGLKTDVAALTSECNGLKTQVAALAAERDTLKAKADAAEQEKADAALASEKTKHAELLQAALTDGRLVPAQKAWAEKQPLAALTEYLEATNPLAFLKKQTDGKDGGNGLTQEELDMCKRMGVSPEEFAKAKK